MPALTVIAGPNGAGKSTLSAALVDFGVPVFDGDKEFQKLQQSFPDLDAAILMDLVNDRVFVEAKKQAMIRRQDFAFETNNSSICCSSNK